MFILTSFASDIRVHPRDLDKPPLVAVTDVIEQQFLDKVIPDLGLLVTIYDVQHIEGGHIYPNDGAAYFKARFRLVVFRPFVGEVLVGRLASSSKDGVRLSLGFFKDVVIPDYALQTPSFFHDAERVWIWKWEGNELHMDPGCEVRFRVSSVRFNPTPTATQLAVSAAAAAAAGAAAPAAGGAAAAAGSSAAAAAAGGAPPLTVHSPMEVIGDIDADGLGVTDWWQPAEEAGDGEAGAAGSDAAL